MIAIFTDTEVFDVTFPDDAEEIVYAMSGRWWVKF
jgi:hypothetical protein